MKDVEPAERRVRRGVLPWCAESDDAPACWDEEMRGENERGCASCPPSPASRLRWEREDDDEERLAAGEKLGGGVDARRDASAWGIATRRMPPPTPSPVMAMGEDGSRFATDCAAAGAADPAVSGRRRDPAGMKLGGIA